MVKLIFFCVLYALLNVTGAGIIKWKLKGRVLNQFHDWLSFLLQVEVIFSFFLVFLSALALFKALSASQFSFVIPLVNGINFSLTILVGYFFFKEQLSLVSYAGILLILTGIILLSLNANPHAQ